MTSSRKKTHTKKTLRVRLRRLKRRFFRLGYWEKCLSFHSEVDDKPPEVNLPQTCSRELRRIRCYDTLNINKIFFVIPGQIYRPSTEVSRSSCKQIKKGYSRTSSPRYYLSFIEGDEEDKKSDSDEPRVVVQIDTESSMLYQKAYLEYYFDKPVQVTGDVRVIFYQKNEWRASLLRLLQHHFH
ncbi:hypothetical protein RchiOBHm_Chr5g0056771 [Rosa chinensis]|uniref:Uncharacterized protein n=1 Tax=Rosa chinensis TaxID=74649 RepID=A0A2P6QGR6_ROSCH|nr:hypothetical protein RchiOBHm_Chr5g0056771 [Rosa chinensis]